MVDLADLRASFDLADKEVDAYIRNAHEERLALLGVLKQPCLRLGVRPARLALDHVREERPRCAAKADEGDRARELAARARDCGEDVAELLVDVDVFAQTRDIRRDVERCGEERARVHLDGHAHGLRDDEDVAEDDRSIEKARVSSDGLQRHLGRELGRAADLEEAMFCTYFTKLWVARS